MDGIRIAGVEWDPGNWPKCGKHGVSQADIDHALRHATFRIPDPNPDEPRFRTAARAPDGRPVFIVYTHRDRDGETWLRPSAPATCTERRSSGMSRSKKPWPTLPTDEAAEAFVETADLADYDWSAAEPVRYEFATKAAALNMRLPQPMLDAVKAKAAAKGMPFTRYIRMLIEKDLSRP